MDFPFLKEAITQLFSKPSTERYPAVPKQACDRYRGRLVFHPELCINCGMCERVCAGGAITRKSEKTEAGEQVTFELFLGSCTFCGCCVDFCPRKAIEFSQDYDITARNKDELKITSTFLKQLPQRPSVPPAAQKPAAQPAPKPEEPAGK